VLLVAVIVAGWGAFGYFSFRSGVEEANARLPESAANALSPQAGSILSSPSNILVLGVDTGPTRDGDPGRSDAMMLIRTDPDAHRIAYLSIPRDLRLDDIPGQGPGKINAAYAIGGPALAIRAVEDLIGQPVNHVAIVDFASFPQVVDSLGGVTIGVEADPVEPLQCPFGSRAECERWDGWRFAAGSQEMNGRRALVYSRIRQNELDPSESDLSRAARQQQVIQAIADEVVSPLGFLRFPFVGADLVTPLATDLTTGELLGLGWLKFRAADDATLRCRLGGEPATVDEGGGETFYLIGGEENIEVVSMVLGESAPQPAPPDQPFAAGCRVGS
jgi:LCP family protein required for cell wall assembly